MILFVYVFIVLWGLFPLNTATNFPTVADLLVDAMSQRIETDSSIIKDDILQSKQIRVSSLAQSNGYLYYNFYSGLGCNETLSYTTGIAADTCMTYQYYSPPDHYYYSYISSLDFGSFQVKSLTDGCATTYIAYYNDSKCEEFRNAVLVSTLGAGQCKRYHNETYTNMQSFKAFCSVTTSIPAPSNTYVMSSYNQTNCQGMAYTFNAYSNDACYGIYSVNSSFSYQCDGNSVLKDDYYSSLTCRASSSAMVINGGCTNAHFISSPVPVAAVSTLVDCGYVSTKATKYTEAQVVGIAMGVVGSLLIISLLAGYFIMGGLFVGSRAVNVASTSKLHDNLIRSSEMSASVSPSMAGRYTSTVEQNINPMQKS